MSCSLSHHTFLSIPPLRFFVLFSPLFFFFSFTPSVPPIFALFSSRIFSSIFATQLFSLFPLLFLPFVFPVFFPTCLPLVSHRSDTNVFSVPPRTFLHLQIPDVIFIVWFMPLFRVFPCPPVFVLCVPPSCLHVLPRFFNSSLQILLFFCFCSLVPPLVRGHPVPLFIPM